MAGVGRTPRSTEVAEDVRDLQSRTGHARRQLCRRLVPVGSQRVRRSNGLVTARIALVATCVVVSSLACPSKTWIRRMSVFCSSKWVAKLCRSVCGVTAS
jgi:hypothetical protein